MRRAILCGALILAGCDRPASRERAGESAHPAGQPIATAGPVRPSEARPGEIRAAGAPSELIPDPAYTPREEDRATLVAGATPGFARASLIDDFYQAPGTEERDRLKEMIDRGDVVELGGRLPVLVIRNLDPADAREPGRHYGVEVRILDGPRRGETWFVDESAVVRLIPKVIHPPLEPGSYAAVVRAGAVAYSGWGAHDLAAYSPVEAAGQEAFRLDEGTRVVVLEGRGGAVQVRVHSGSTAVGHVGVMARSDLRPLVPQSSPAAAGPAGR